jgi:hypothetical protein
MCVHRGVAMGLACLAAWALPAAWAGGPPANAQPERRALRCEPVYMPARSTWVREVELVGQEGRLSEVRIDGQKVYAFSVRDTTVLTAMDNERIEIDFGARTWRSDFRGLSSAQGRCELSAP